MSLKETFKQFSKSEGFRRFTCSVIAAYIRLVHLTSRTRMDMHESAKPYARGELNALYAFWHGRLLMIAPLRPPGRYMRVLISTHRDGAMIANTMAHFDIGWIQGSSSRGAVTAAMGAVKALQAGENIAITPDGPRGPEMKVQSELAKIAELANVPIIPVTYSASMHKRMKSWDRFMVALPFCTLYYKVGAPILNADNDALERTMVQMTEEVDRLANR